MSNTTPYYVAELRDKSGNLDSKKISQAFGFDKVNFAKVSKEYFFGEGPKNFDELVLAQGYGTLTSLAMLVAKVLDPNRKLPEQDLYAQMRNYLLEQSNGVTRLDAVRQGDAGLLVEDIYGGVRKDLFGAPAEDVTEISDWLGLDKTELEAVAKLTGLAVLEAVASTLLENGYKVKDLKERLNLANGGPTRMDDFLRSFIMTYMFKGKGLNAVWLWGSRIRDCVNSNIDEFEMVYRRRQSSK